VSNITRSVLGNNEAAIVQISKEVATAKHLHHNLDLVLIFKHVVEPVD